MTDAVLVFQSFLYDGTLPGWSDVYAFPPRSPGMRRLSSRLLPRVMGDFMYLVLGCGRVRHWLACVRKYEARLPRSCSNLGEPVVVVDHVSKKYRLYRERNASIKVALMRGERAKFDFRRSNISASRWRKARRLV